MIDWKQINKLVTKKGKNIKTFSNVKLFMEDNGMMIGRFKMLQRGNVTSCQVSLTPFIFIFSLSGLMVIITIPC